MIGEFGVTFSSTGVYISGVDWVANQEAKHKKVEEVFEYDNGNKGKPSEQVLHFNLYFVTLLVFQAITVFTKVPILRACPVDFEAPMYMYESSFEKLYLPLE